VTAYIAIDAVSSKADASVSDLEAAALSSSLQLRSSDVLGQPGQLISPTSPTGCSMEGDFLVTRVESGTPADVAGRAAEGTSTPISSSAARALSDAFASVGCFNASLPRVREFLVHNQQKPGAAEALQLVSQATLLDQHAANRPKRPQNLAQCLTVQAAHVPNTCFGAVGSGCQGVPPKMPCTCNDDGSIECQVTVASNMHDVCCVQHPNGDHCGGSADDDYCTDPETQKASTLCCAPEWRRSVSDVFLELSWSKTFDPANDNTADLASTVYARGSLTATPGPFALKAPSGTTIRSVDAAMGWCENPTRVEGMVTLLGGQTVCN
jgi:hypothetical protein